MKTLILSLLVFCVSTPALALKVLSVKDGRMILDTEGAAPSLGDRFTGRDAEGKVKVIMEIKLVKSNRALGVPLRGASEMNLTFTPYTGKVSSSSAGSSSAGATTATPSYADSGSSSKAKPTRARAGEVGKASAAGFMVGFANNTMNVKPNGASEVSLTGSSISASGMYQMPVDGRFGARLLFGYETLQAKGEASTAICKENTTSCEVDLSYLGIEALGKYSYIQNRDMDAWVGLGLGFLFAIGKNSNILDTSKISTNQTVVASLGLDWFLGPTSFIPLQFDYAIFPDNSTSSATQMIIRGGYGFTF